MNSSSENSLYERIGGEEAVIRLVDKFYSCVLADEEIGRFFSNTPIDRLKNMQKEFFTIALGGPGDYSGLTLAHAHQGRGIQSRHFRIFVDHLLETLSEFNLTEEDRYQIISDINRFVEDIAEDSAAPIG